MAISSMFGELNKAILGNVLNNKPDTTVEGRPMQAMDNINPMLRGAAQGFGGAMGADPASLQTSQQSVATEKAARVKSHRDAVIKRAEDMGLEGVSEGLKAGGSIKDYLPQILEEEKRRFQEKERLAAEESRAAAATLAHRRGGEDRDAEFENSISMLSEEDKIAARREKRERDNTRDYQDFEGSTYVVDGNGNRLFRVSKTKEEYERLQDEQAAKIEGEVKKLDALASSAEKSENIKGNVEAVRGMYADLYQGPGAGAVNAGAAKIPGSAAWNANQYLTSLKAKLGLGEMQRLKDNSPTGSTGFGSLSAPELDLLLSAAAALNISQSKEAFEDNLAIVERYSDRVLEEWEAIGDGREIPVSYKSAFAVAEESEQETPKVDFDAAWEGVK